MPSGNSAISAPLDADLLQKLGELLDEHAVPNGGLPLEATDGLISAAVVSPGEPVQSSQCMPLILGSERWSDAAAKTEAEGLLLALWNDVGRRVASDPETATTDVSPVIGVPPGFDEMSDQQIEDSGYQMGSSWAFGFVLGADLRREEWERRLSRDKDLEADFYDIFALMPDEVFSDDDFADDDEIGDADDDELAGAIDVETDEDDEDDRGEGENDLSHADRVEVIDALPGILFAMNKVRLKELS